jgi:hypothetical protein
LLTVNNFSIWVNQYIVEKRILQAPPPRKSCSGGVMNH